MNEQLQNFARQTLKDGLAQLPPERQRNFKLMYSSGNTVEDKLSKDIVDVVDSMPAEQLDWAMQQVQNSLAKIGEQATEQAKESEIRKKG